MELKLRNLLLKGFALFIIIILHQAKVALFSQASPLPFFLLNWLLQNYMIDFICCFHFLILCVGYLFIWFVLFYNSIVLMFYLYIFFICIGAEFGTWPSNCMITSVYDLPQLNSSPLCYCSCPFCRFAVQQQSRAISLNAMLCLPSLCPSTHTPSYSLCSFIVFIRVFCGSSRARHV